MFPSSGFSGNTVWQIQLSVRMKEVILSFSSNTWAVMAGFSSTAMISPAFMVSRSFRYTFLNFSTSSCHDPYGRMLCGDGDSGTYYIRVFEERAADEKQCQYPEEYGYSPPDQCVWRSRQYLLHLLTPQFYVLFFLFLHNSQLSIFNSPLIKVPIGSSPACNIFLPEQSALHAFRSLLSCPVL